jgi:predicted Zn-dependent protease
MGLAFEAGEQSTAGVQMKRISIPVALLIGVTACGISTQQEVQMGQQEAAQINQQLPIVSDPEANRYINLLGDQIATKTSRGDLNWRFFIVDAAEVNAFAVPGGYVYVNRGLIERTDRMDELAGVLGHEIEHVVLRHTIKQMEQMQGANLGLTLACVLTNVCNSGIAQAAINVGGTAVFAKFSRGDEAQADAGAVPNVVRAGINPNGVVSMFEKLIAERKSRPGAVDAFFATHPGEEERIAAVQAEINKIPASTMRGLTVNTTNYNSFRARIRSLPPSPRPRTQ